MADTAADMMSRAKSKLIMFHPFFAAIICSLPISEDNSIPTMATNGKWVKYNSNFVQALSIEELVFVLCHEVGHVMFVHPFRRQHRDPMGWNIAGDFIINNLLVSDNVGTMPANGLHDPALVEKGGGTTDGVYDLLPDQMKNGGSNWQPGEKGMPMDQCMDSGGDAAEQAAAEADAKVMVAGAANAAKVQGKLSANLQRLVDHALKPKVAWQDVLRRFISTKAKVDYTYARPKRRFLAEDLYLPSLGGQRMGDILIAVDCSGSIGQQELNEFAAEMRAIKEDCLPANMHVLYFDSRVCHYDKFGSDDELTVAPHGGGGTAFSPIFAYAEEHDIDPVCCVVLTDLYCSDFGPPTSYPTMWVSTHSDQAPWGEVIMMKDRMQG